MSDSRDTLRHSWYQLDLGAPVKLDNRKEKQQLWIKIHQPCLNPQICTESKKEEIWPP